MLTLVPFAGIKPKAKDNSAAQSNTVAPTAQGIVLTQVAVTQAEVYKCWQSCNDEACVCSASTHFPAELHLRAGVTPPATTASKETDVGGSDVVAPTVAAPLAEVN